VGRFCDENWVSDLVGIVVYLRIHRAPLLDETAYEAETEPITVEQGAHYLQAVIQVETILEALVSKTEVFSNQRCEAKLWLEGLVVLRGDDVE